MDFKDKFPKFDMPKVNIPKAVATEIRVPRYELPTMPRIKSPAEWAYERIAKMVNDFEAELSEDDEIGLRLVATPDTSVMHIEDIGYWGPDMLIYHGTNEHSKPMTLVQHNTQMSILLTAVPKVGEKPRRIGFHLIGKISGDGEEPDEE